MSTQVIEAKSSYSTLFEKFRENSPDAFPAWVEELRERAIEHFEAVGFPTTADEDYKYTNVSAIAKGDFQPSNRDAQVGADEIENFLYEEASASRLVFLNGVYQPQLSSVESLPKEIVASDLRSALSNERIAPTVREYLARGAEASGDDAFTALNTAFFTSGAFIYVPQDVRVDAPVHLLFLTDAKESKVASFPRVLVVAEPHTELTLIEDHAAVEENSSYFTSPLIEIFVGDEARVTHYKVQRESESAFHVARTRAEAGRASIYNSTTVNLGASLVRHNINLQLRGQGSETWIDGLYLVDGDQHADTHSLINHFEPYCTSHQSYKGILDGRGRGVFNGRIFVHQGAQKTDAYQSNKNLILSDTARVDTKPQLEIFADDVKCSHGATVGQLNEDELFYLRSRGLEPELARNLLTYGFAEEIVEKIKFESIKKQLDAAILNRLHANLEA
jgi:Fe-S cluster assembly protein SufD